MEGETALTRRQGVSGQPGGTAPRRKRGFVPPQAVQSSAAVALRLWSLGAEKDAQFPSRAGRCFQWALRRVDPHQEGLL